MLTTKLRGVFGRREKGIAGFLYNFDWSYGSHRKCIYALSVSPDDMASDAIGDCIACALCRFFLDLAYSYYPPTMRYCALKTT